MNASQTSTDERNANESPEPNETLVAMIRATFPHERVPQAAYERTAQIVQREADGTTWMKVKLSSGLDSLEGLVDGRFTELNLQEAVQVLRRIQHTPFFGFVRQTAVVNLYEDEELWAALGYEGPSFHKGGYINRGFDDLDWLPDPRIEEYEGDPLPELLPELPVFPSAASTRGAAVPAGESKARAGRIESGREQQR